MKSLFGVDSSNAIPILYHHLIPFRLFITSAK